MPHAPIDRFAWEQLPEETSKAYRAFCAYRSLRENRHVLTAFRVYAGQPEARNASGVFRDWSQRFDWQHRASEWDAWNDQQERKARETTFVADLEGYRTRNINIAKACTSTAARMLMLINNQLDDLVKNRELVGAKQLPAYARAAAACAQTASAMEAQALGVEELIRHMSENGDLEE